MSRAKELLKAGLENRGAQTEPARVEESSSGSRKKEVQTEQTNDLEAVLLDKQPQSDRIVKRTFEMRESHVDTLDKIVKRAKNNGKRTTQSDALQFIISNWNDKFGSSYLD